jgi:hypothetical protein
MKNYLRYMFSGWLCAQEWRKLYSEPSKYLLLGKYAPVFLDFLESSKKAL